VTVHDRAETPSTISLKQAPTIAEIRSGRSKTAESALEQALIARFGTLGRVPAPFLLRSANGLVFISRGFTALVKGYGLRQEFINPHNPQQNGMV
jgi:putative transposase